MRNFDGLLEEICQDIPKPVGSIFILFPRFNFPKTKGQKLIFVQRLT